MSRTSEDLVDRTTVEPSPLVGRDTHPHTTPVACPSKKDNALGQGSGLCDVLGGSPMFNLRIIRFVFRSQEGNRRSRVLLCLIQKFGRNREGIRVLTKLQESVRCKNPKRVVLSVQP